VLQQLATLGDEQRGDRLRESLAAYDQALRFRTPEAAPLDYATTQNNRGNVLQQLATLGDEQRGVRLRESLAAYDQALRFHTPEAAPLDYAMTQGNLLKLYQALAALPEEDRRMRLLDALRAGWAAFHLFGQLQHSHYQQQAARQLQGLSRASGDDFETLWAALQAGPLPEWLSGAAEDQRSPEWPQAFRAALGQYTAQVQAAQDDAENTVAWQAAVAAGEALLAPALADTPDINWDALRANLASTYNDLGNTLDNSDKAQALVAYERAIALQPEFAMWRRNRAGTLIELGRLDQAAAEIERARTLEPEAARLAELGAELQQARNGAPADPDEETNAD
jgi:hypothetical protein